MLIKLILKNKIFNEEISSIEINKKNVINTINAHSYCVSKNDPDFLNSLMEGDILIPDGISMVMAAKFLNGTKINKISGEDIHSYLLSKADSEGLSVFYMGSNLKTLIRIESRVQSEFPKVEMGYYSPPFKSCFSEIDSMNMVERINEFQPDILFIGMTAPKQEKWVYEHKSELKCGTIASIGAVFDFYAGNINRAPKWMVKYGLEWLYRFIKEPRRLWRRYLINNTKFVGYVIKEYFS